MSAWLEVLGRAHPMVLHLPIGLLVGLAVLELFEPPRGRAAKGLVAVTVLSCLTAIGTGLLHAREPGFSGSAFEQHRNWGLALGAVVLAMAALHVRAAKSAGARTPYRVALVAGLALLVPTGHWGAQLTHGPGFLTEPLRRDEVEPTPVPEASSYATLIRPILDAKCGACHGATKQKGGLSLASAERILAGGRHGPVIVGAESLLALRIALPLDHDKHMPPEDQDQLAPAELVLLQQWIAAGAPFDGRVEALELVAAAAPASAPQAAIPAAPSIPPASAQSLAALRDALAHVQPISDGSPLLWIDFAAAAKGLDDARARELLLPVRAQLADLSLARSAVGDGTLAILADFPALVKLDLRATAVTERGIASLAAHPALAELILAQTRLGDGVIDSLIAMPALARVHLWRSGLSPEAIARLREARPSLDLDAGDTPASAALEREGELAFGPGNAPAAATSTAASPSLAPINTKCPVTGAPVKPEFRVVHEGRVIGFCCSECPKAFWDEPAKFAGALQ